LRQAVTDRTRSGQPNVGWFGVPIQLALVLLPLQNHQALLVRPVDQLPLDLACHDYEGLESSHSFAVMNRL